MVIFRVGQEEYAVSIAAVREVVPWTKPTAVPDAPPAVEGVVDLRGEVFPVIELARLFGTQRSHTDADSRIIIMEMNGHQAGFVVDDVTEVQNVTPGMITPPSPVLHAGGAGSAISGILRLGEGRLVVLVDAASILTGAQISGV